MKQLLFIGLLGLSACDPYAHCDDPGAMCTVMGDGEVGLANEGDVATEARMYWPSDVTAGPDGNPWIADWNNHRIITIRDDEVVRITGNGLVGDGPIDSPAYQAFWNHPTNITFREDGSFVFAAWHNSRVVAVDPVGDSMELVAGNGTRAFSGDGGPAVDAGFDLPVGVEYDDDGNLYVADQANQRIRRIDTDGNITTVVGDGTAGYLGDGGPALEAQLNNDRSQNAEPAGRIAVSGRTMLIADTNNHVVRAVDLDTWTIETVAGTGQKGNGDDGAALETAMGHPRDVAFGPDGEFYVVDGDNSCIRRFEGGQSKAVAGVCGEVGFDGEDDPAIESRLNLPLGFDVGPDGTIWIADTYNQRIRRVNPE